MVPVRDVAAEGRSPGDGSALRVVTYNIRHQRDDPVALVRVLRALAPDVALLQEGPRGPRWRAHVAALARDTDLLVCTGGPWAGSNLVLVAMRVQVRWAHDLRYPVRHRLQPRGAAVAGLRVSGRDLVVASTHLSLDAAERPGNVTALTSFLAQQGAGARAVVAGDLNEPPDGPSWRGLAGVGLRDAWSLAPRGGELTFSARNPRRRIDGVFISNGIAVAGCGTPAGEGLDTDVRGASDHLPVVADLTLH